MPLGLYRLNQKPAIEIKKAVERLCTHGPAACSSMDDYVNLTVGATRARTNPLLTAVTRTVAMTGMKIFFI